MFGQKILSWQAYIRPHYQRSFRWYVVVGVFVLTLVAYAIFTQAFTMAAVFIVLAGVYFLLHRNDPEVVTISLTTLGIQVAEKFYPYAEMKSFYIIHEPPYISELHFFLLGKIVNEVSLQIEGVDPSDIREVLFHRGIGEIAGKKESLSHILLRIFGI